MVHVCMHVRESVCVYLSVAIHTLESVIRSVYTTLGLEWRSGGVALDLCRHTLDSLTARH